MGKKQKLARRTIIFKSRINALSAAHWAVIIKAATKYVGKKKGKPSGERYTPWVPTLRNTGRCAGFWEGTRIVQYMSILAGIAYSMQTEGS